MTLPVSAFQTFSIRRPATPDFWRTVTCEEAKCEAWRFGWETAIDLNTELGQAQAAYIVKRSGRRFSQEREGDLIRFVFTPGQQCFREHKVAVEREPLFIVRPGDARGNPRPDRTRRHKRGADWVENMQEEFGKVAEDRKRG